MNCSVALHINKRAVGCDWWSFMSQLRTNSIITRKRRVSEIVLFPHSCWLLPVSCSSCRKREIQSVIFALTLSWLGGPSLVAWTQFSQCFKQSLISRFTGARECGNRAQAAHYRCGVALFQPQVRKGVLQKNLNIESGTSTIHLALKSKFYVLKAMNTNHRSS